MHKELLESLGVVVEELCSYYQELPRIIDRETQGICDYDLAAIQTWGAHKDEMAKKIHAAVKGSAAIVGDLMRSFELESRDEQSFEQLVVDIESSLVLKENPDLRAPLGQLRAQIERFTSQVDQIQPQVEENRFVLAHLLANYQQSFHFWQELVAAESAGYTPSGSRAEPGGSGSGFVVKA